MERQSLNPAENGLPDMSVTQLKLLASHLGEQVYLPTEPGVEPGGAPVR